MNHLYKIHISQLEKLYKLTNSISRKLTTGIVFLYGDLGVGKTTFVQSFIKNLGYKGKVTSPSYGIINQYSIDDGLSIIHADLYRITNAEELLYLDVDEWVDMADIIFIEWPEQGKGYLPEPDIAIYLSLDKNERWIAIKVNDATLAHSLQPILSEFISYQ